MDCVTKNSSIIVRLVAEVCPRFRPSPVGSRGHLERDDETAVSGFVTHLLKAIAGFEECLDRRRALDRWDVVLLEGVILELAGILEGAHAVSPRTALRIFRESAFEQSKQSVLWIPTGRGEPTYEFALFSRSGLKRSVEEAADERDDLRLFDLSDIVVVLENRVDD